MPIKEELSIKGSQCVLLKDEQSESWLVYRTTDENGDRIEARQISTGMCIQVSENGIDCADLTAAGGENGVVLLWTQLQAGSYQLYEGNLKGSVPKQIVQPQSSIINPAMVIDSEGVPCVVYQSSDDEGYFKIYMQRKINNLWTTPAIVSDMPGNNWNPAITCCSDGKLAVAWDGYASGSYDIYLRFFDCKMAPKPIIRLTNDDLFHANVSLSPAPNGSVWVAWNMGTKDWGKDNEVHRGNRTQERNYLHARRFLEVRRVAPSFAFPVFPPIQDFLDSKLPGLLYERPKLFSTADGPLYLAFRYNIGDPSGGHRTEKRWQAILTCFDGEDWSKCIELESAYGLSTGAISILQNNENSIYAAACGEGGEKKTKLLETKINIYELKSLAKKLELKDPPIKAQVYSVPGGIPCIKRYSTKHNGNEYNVYFGDLHRHTELSYCRTSVDGSLEEAYRYAKDAAEMDFVMTADHNQHQLSRDMWEQTLKNADRFYIPAHFTTFFGNEWNGGPGNKRHRNLVSTIRVPNYSYEYEEGDYRDVRKAWAKMPRGKAITIPHHTACNMSLLWGKDLGEASDPEYEPLVEIFQASRTSSEYLGCPTLCNAYNQNGQSERFNVKGGFVSDALKQGIRIGFIASSDHMSTHRSYACVYAKDNTRDSIMEGMKSRRAYAATDRIICDFKIDNAIMGEEIAAKRNGPLEVYIRFIGTGKIKEIVLLRDSVPYRTWNPLGQEMEINTQLTMDESKGHYFYVRMIQEDSNLAWASPIWID